MGVDTFIEAIRQAGPFPALEEPGPGQTFAGVMSIAMGEMLEAARERLRGCFHEDRSLLIRMKSDGVRVDLGEPHPSAGYECEETPSPDGVPALINMFDNRGSGGLMWGTSIGIGNTEASLAGTGPEGQALCLTRLADGIKAHADVIERDLAQFQELSPEAKPGGQRHGMSYSELAADNRHFLVIAAADVRNSDRFAAYLQIRTTFYP